MAANEYAQLIVGVLVAVVATGAVAGTSRSCLQSIQSTTVYRIKKYDTALVCFLTAQLPNPETYAVTVTQITGR